MEWNSSRTYDLAFAFSKFGQTRSITYIIAGTLYSYQCGMIDFPKYRGVI